MNVDVADGRNKVIVTTRPSGLGYGESLLVAKLGVGGDVQSWEYLLFASGAGNGEWMGDRFIRW